MRVLFPFVGDSVGGSHKSTILLIKFLETKKVEIIVVLHKEYEPLIKLLEKEKIDYLLLPSSGLAGSNSSLIHIIFNILKNFLPFSFFLLKHKIDIVHGNDLRINLSWSLPTILTLKKFIWHQRQVLSNSKLWMLINVLSSHCIAISDYVFESIPKNIPIKSKSRVYNPFVFSEKNLSKIEEIKRNLEIREEAFVIAYVGRVVKRHNLDVLIKSIPPLTKEITLKVLIVGRCEENYLKELSDLSRGLGLKKNVSFVGYVENPEDYMWLSDLVVCPGRNEAFGRVVVEAMMTNTPVIASRSGAHLEIIQERKNGLTCRLEDSIDLQNKIQELINDKKLYQKIKSNCQETFNSFSLKRHGDSILEIYNSFDTLWLQTL